MSVVAPSVARLLLTCRPCTRHCRQLSTSLVAHRRVVFTSRPVSRGTERRILNAVTVPIIAPDMRPPEEICYDKMMEKKAKNRSEIMDLWNEFLMTKVRALLSHQMVAICHRLPLSKRDTHTLKVKVHQGGMSLQFMRNDLALKAVEDTNLRNMKPYFTSSTAYIVSEEVDLKKLMKILKKCPELQLLGGLVGQRRLMSRDEMLAAALLPSLQGLHAKLAHLLQQPASQVHGTLGSHPQALAASLSSYASDQETNTQTDKQEPPHPDTGDAS